MGYVDFYTFLIPLYALSLGFDASEIGILVGARSIVAMFLSIHIGVLMDRFGTRKLALGQPEPERESAAAAVERWLLAALDEERTATVAAGDASGSPVVLRDAMRVESYPL